MFSPTSETNHFASIIDLDRPNPARVDNALLGGAHNFAADRHAAARLLATDPMIANRLATGRYLLRRVTGLALGLGIRQFIHLGCGIPFPWGIHTVVRDEATARVIYVDDDPVVVEIIRQVLGRDPTVSVVEADPGIRAAAGIDRLRGDQQLCGLVDFDQPFVVLSSPRSRGIPMPPPAPDQAQPDETRPDDARPDQVAQRGPASSSTTLHAALMDHEITVTCDDPRWLEITRSVLVPPCSTTPTTPTTPPSPSADHRNGSGSIGWHIEAAQLPKPESAEPAGHPQLGWPAGGVGLTVLGAGNGTLRLVGRYRPTAATATITTDHRRRTTSVGICQQDQISRRWPDWLARLGLGTRLLGDGWTLLHAAAVCFPTPAGERALLILADAAGGKSTLAHQACVDRSARLLADDLVLVRAGDEGVTVIGWPTRMCLPLDLLSNADLRRLDAYPIVSTAIDGYQRRRMILTPGEYAEAFSARRAGPTRLGAVLVVRPAHPGALPRVHTPLEPDDLDLVLVRAQRVRAQRLMMLDLLGIVGSPATSGDPASTAARPVAVSARELNGVVTVGLDLPTGAVPPAELVWNLLAQAWQPIAGGQR